MHALISKIKPTCEIENINTIQEFYNNHKEKTNRTQRKSWWQGKQQYRLLTCPHKNKISAKDFSKQYMQYSSKNKQCLYNKLMNIQQPNHLTYMFTYCHLCLIVTVFKYLFFVFVCNNKCMYLEHKQFYCQQEIVKF